MFTATRAVLHWATVLVGQDLAFCHPTSSADRSKPACATFQVWDAHRLKFYVYDNSSVLRKLQSFCISTLHLSVRSNGYHWIPIPTSSLNQRCIHSISQPPHPINGGRCEQTDAYVPHAITPRDSKNSSGQLTATPSKACYQFCYP